MANASFKRATPKKAVNLQTGNNAPRGAGVKGSTKTGTARKPGAGMVSGKPQVSGGSGSGC